MALTSDYFEKAKGPGALPEKEIERIRAQLKEKMEVDLRRQEEEAKKKKPESPSMPLPSDK